MKMIRLTKRQELPGKKALLITLIAVLLSIVCAGIILLILGLNPLQVFKEIIVGSVGTGSRIQQTISRAIPLTITSLGIIVAFKMKFWNIGGEGQITMGALGATWVAFTLSPQTPTVVMLILMMVAAAICGGIWAFIPAFFKAKFGTNETIFTLMMNYIAIKFVMYLQYGPWKDPARNGFPKMPNFTENAQLPSVFGINIGWIIALLAAVGVYLFFKYTKLGYEITVVGESVQTAKYAGMNISKIIIIAMIISGGLCGITGMIQVSAMEKTLVYGIAGGYGFTAIITAWLSKLRAGWCVLICLVFAMLIQGGQYIQIALGIPSSVAEVVEGLILFFILGSEFFLRYKVHFNFGKKEKKELKDKEVA